MRAVPAALTRADALRSGAALLITGAGLAALAPTAEAIPPNSTLGALPAGDLANVRLLIALELLTIDFYGHALAAGQLSAVEARNARLVHANERDHYAFLARVVAASGGVPLTSADIDFSYPQGAFERASSLLDLAVTLETLSLSAHLGAAGSVVTPALSGAVAQIAANEAQHRGAFAPAARATPFQDAFPEPFTMEEASNALDAYTS